MLEIETGYIKITDDKYEIINYPWSADEVDLEVDEYYAIFVPDSMIYEVEIYAPYYNTGKTERGEEYHVYGFCNYQNYIYELAALEDDDEDDF